MTITCTGCKLALAWDPEKEGMVDISGSTCCTDLHPHRPDQPPQPWHRWAINEDPAAPTPYLTSTDRPDHCLACGVVRWPATYVARLRASGPCQAVPA